MKPTSCTMSVAMAASTSVMKHALEFFRETWHRPKTSAFLKLVYRVLDLNFFWKSSCTQPLGAGLKCSMFTSGFFFSAWEMQSQTGALRQNKSGQAVEKARGIKFSSWHISTEICFLSTGNFFYTRSPIQNAINNSLKPFKTLPLAVNRWLVNGIKQQCFWAWCHYFQHNSLICWRKMITEKLK